MKKAYSQQLFNNRPLGELSSQASLSVGFILKFLLNFSDSILASSSGVCTVDWAFQRGFSLAGPSSFSARAHGWLWQRAEAVLLTCSQRLVGTVTTAQIMAPLLNCKQKRSSLTWVLLTAVSIFLFVFGMGFLSGFESVCAHFQSPPQALPKALCRVAKRGSMCHQISLYRTFHSRVHLGIQETETALTYRVDHKLLVN